MKSAAPATEQSTLRRHLGMGACMEKAYSVSPCGVFVPANSDIRAPENLANIPISVSYQSGSHYSTIQALEPFLTADEIKLSFSDGLLFRRMEHQIDGNIPAVSLFSGLYYFMQQLGFRKILDTTFMMAAMVAEDASMADVEKFLATLRKAQPDIDLRPELYKHYYCEEFPERFRDQIDTRLFGPGERIVFEPYLKEILTQSREWIDEKGIFETCVGERSFEQSVIL